VYFLDQAGNGGHFDVTVDHVVVPCRLR
jgi:hypothetical protein